MSWGVKWVMAKAAELPELKDRCSPEMVLAFRRSPQRCHATYYCALGAIPSERRDNRKRSRRCRPIGFDRVRTGLHAGKIMSYFGAFSVQGETTREKARHQTPRRNRQAAGAAQAGGNQRGRTHRTHRAQGRARRRRGRRQRPHQSLRRTLSSVSEGHRGEGGRSWRASGQHSDGLSG